MTDKEREEFKQEKEAAEIQSAHAIKIKELELEVAKLEARWSSWLKLPMAIIMLPVRIILAIAFVICSITKFEPPQVFWDVLRGGK